MPTLTIDDILTLVALLGTLVACCHGPNDTDDTAGGEA